MNVRADQGEALWWFGNLAVIKATAADTGGGFTLLDVTNRPGEDIPWFVSQNYALGFWVIEGSAEFGIGDEAVQASAGDFLAVPRGVQHRHRISEQGCRWLLLAAPAGLEEFVRAVAVPAATRTLPATPIAPPDLEALLTLGKIHGMEPADLP